MRYNFLPDIPSDVTGGMRQFCENLRTWLRTYILHEHEPVFAEIYVASGSTAQSFEAGTTYIKSTAFTTDGGSKNCTADAANDQIVITKKGWYSVIIANNGYSGTASIQWHSAIFLNGVKCDNIQRDSLIQNANTPGTFVSAGKIEVTEIPSIVDWRICHDNGSAVNFTVINCNLNVEYMGAL